jgi:hypothetical protein
VCQAAKAEIAGCLRGLILTISYDQWQLVNHKRLSRNFNARVLLSSPYANA